MKKPVKYALISTLIAVVLASTCLERNGYFAFLAAGKHMRKRQLDEALEKLNKTVERNPKFGVGYSFRGLIHEIQFRFDEALADYERAVELRPKFFGVYASRGALYEKKHLWDKALADYDKAIELKPEYPDIYAARARIHAHQGNFALGNRDFAKAMELAPGKAKPYVDRAITLATYGLYQRALDDVDSAEQLDSSFALQYLVRAHVLANMRDFSGAERSLKRYEALHEPSPGVDAAWGSLHSDRGEYEKALERLARSTEGYPESPLPFALRGLTYARMRRFDEARAELDSALAIDTNQAYTHFHVACLHALQDSVELALAALRAAVDKGLADPSLLRTGPDLAPLRAAPAFATIVARVDSLASLW